MWTTVSQVQNGGEGTIASIMLGGGLAESDCHAAAFYCAETYLTG